MRKITFFFQNLFITEISNTNTEITVQTCINKLELLTTIGLASGEMQTGESLKLSLTKNSSPSTLALVYSEVNEHT